MKILGVSAQSSDIYDESVSYSGHVLADGLRTAQPRDRGSFSGRGKS